MDAVEPLALIGGTGSPYTRKMLALLRYRRIPYAIRWGDPAAILDQLAVEKPRPVFHPTFLMPAGDGVRATCDSTPIIRDLEQRYSGRSVIPSDPALDFINYLVEDFGDEWCTKYMFHYRWYPQEDADNAGTLLPLSMQLDIPEQMHSQFKAAFAERQISRLYVVGSNDVTAPVIDASYRRFLAAMDRCISESPFLLGARPAACDYAVFGQLTQLVGFDPTPRAIAHELAPRTVAWVGVMEDLSGLAPEDDQWNAIDDLGQGLHDLLCEIGRVYVPALLANAQALEAGEKTWETTIDGATWTQQTFPYQGKCLRWINEKYQALEPEDRQRVDAVLSSTGCEDVIVAA